MTVPQVYVDELYELMRCIYEALFDWHLMYDDVYSILDGSLKVTKYLYSF